MKPLSCGGEGSSLREIVRQKWGCAATPTWAKSDTTDHFALTTVP